MIDDTYNASPVAVNAALDVLYGLKSKQRIAILGSMNELGVFSPEAHRFQNMGDGTLAHSGSLAIRQAVAAGTNVTFKILANGVVNAVKQVGLAVPLVVRLEGTNAELGKKIINESGLNVIAANDLSDGAEKIVKAVRGLA